MSTALAIPTTQELEQFSPSDRWDLEERLDDAQDLLREFNDDELRRWIEDEGKTQREVAQLVGRSKTAIANRCNRLGLHSGDPRGGSRGLVTPDQSDVQDAEVVEGEVVGPSRPHRSQPEGPTHHFPDVVAPDADENLRTQALHWFEQGAHLKDLLDRRRPLEARSPEDRKAIQREAAAMERVARRLKEAANA